MKKVGMYKGKEPEVNTKGLGTRLLQITGIGLAAGIAMVAATDKIMKKVTASKEK